MGPVVSVSLAIVAIITAQSAKQTAEIAAREYAIASSPAVFLTDVKPRLIDKLDGSGTVLWVTGTFRDVRGIPTTVQNVRAGYYFQWEPTSETRWHNVWEEFPVYGEHLTRPVMLGRVDTEHLEAHKARNLRDGVNLPYVKFKIEYTISVLGGPREVWSLSFSVYSDANGKFSTRQFTPEIRPVSVE